MGRVALCYRPVPPHRRRSKDNSGGCVPCTSRDTVGSMCKGWLLWGVFICCCLQFYGVHLVSSSSDHQTSVADQTIIRPQLGPPRDDQAAPAREGKHTADDPLAPTATQSGGKKGWGKKPGSSWGKSGWGKSNSNPPASGDPSSNSLSKRASRASVAIRNSVAHSGRIREFVGQGSGDIVSELFALTT